MLAEMLAIVCHAEYYQQGEQTVSLLLSINVSLTKRLLFSTLPVSRLQFTGRPSLPRSSGRSIPGFQKISLSPWKSNILDPAIFSIRLHALPLFSISLRLSDMSLMDVLMSVNYGDLEPSFIVLWIPGLVQKKTLWIRHKRPWMIANWRTGSRIPLNIIPLEVNCFPYQGFIDHK